MIFLDLRVKTSSKKGKYARVLAYLSDGHLNDHRPAYQKKPLVQAISEDKFILIELSPKDDVIPTVYDRVYIGEGEREVIDHVIRRLEYKKLMPAATEELPNVLGRILKEDEKKVHSTIQQSKGNSKICARRENEFDIR